LYLIEGRPGAGKTTLGLQFLLAGAEQGEPCLYVTLSETERELREVATSHGWSLDGITLCELQGSGDGAATSSHYTFFHPAEIELSEAIQRFLGVAERLQPRRVVLDSLSELRLLARDSLRYRRQVLALKHHFDRMGCTVLLINRETQDEDFQIASIAHGVLQLETPAQEYGGARRRLKVDKIRGISYRSGYHDFTIQTGGLIVYPRLVAAEHREEFPAERVPSGVKELDTLVGGGLERGTSVLFLGPSGVGKSTLTMQYVRAAAERGEPVQCFLFDEGLSQWRARARGLGMDLEGHLRAGRIRLRQVDPAELSPGALAHAMRSAVEDHGARLLVIDSLNGYQASMSEERFINLHLHELLAYLSQKGALTLMVMAQHGLLGQAVASPLELSYIADTVVLIRYFEAAGTVRQAISVVKKRIGRHERAIRELEIAPPQGIRVGAALCEFTGVLTGRPQFGGERDRLLHDDG
jgi:circadian clock protein KaiC